MSCGNKPGSNRKADPARTPDERYTTASYRRAIHRACDKANIARWSPHQLRHAAATEIRKRHGVEMARIILGHRSLGMTELYAERDMSQAEQAIGEMG